MLNGIDAVIIVYVIGFGIYNVIRYLTIAKIRNFYLITFYVISIICLICWAITAIANMIDPMLKTVVYQARDDHNFVNVIADICLSFWYILFALVSVMIFHLDSALTLLLPDEFKMTKEKV